MRAALAVLLLVAGCHGTDLRVGTGHTFADGGSSGSVAGKHGSAGAWDVDTEDSSSLWVELGFQLTPQTVIVRHADDHGLEPLYPPAPVVSHLAERPPPPLVIGREPAPGVEAPPPCEDDGFAWWKLILLASVASVVVAFAATWFWLGCPWKAPRAPRRK